MATRFKLVLAHDIVSIALGWRHILIGVGRVLMQRSSLHHIESLSKRYPFLTSVKSRDKVLLCRVCGFAMARATMPNGWSIDSCSAYQIEELLQSKGLQSWLGDLPAQAQKPEMGELTVLGNNLPSPGD